MGAFFTNFQVRSESLDAVAAALKSLVKSAAFVSPPKNGWVTVYEKTADTQDEAVLRRIAMGLSRTLATHVVAFLVHDSDVLMYWLYRDGQLVDEFNSSPDYFGGHVDTQTRDRVRGDTDALLPLCTPGTERQQLDEVLHPSDGVRLGAEETLQDLVKLLGLDESRVLTGFRYFSESDTDEALDDADQFVALGSSAKRAKRRARPNVARKPSTPYEPFPDVVAMMCQGWGSKNSFNAVGSMMPALGQNVDAILVQVAKRMDKQAARMLDGSALADRPSLDELKAARDAGPDALAELIRRRVPEQINAVGARAAAMGFGDFLSALLDRGLDVNARHESGMTLLMGAAQNGLAEHVSRLIKAGADLNARMYDGSTALVCAARRDIIEVVQQLLLAGADPLIPVNSGETALSVAAYHGRDSKVYRLLEKGTEGKAP